MPITDNDLELLDLWLDGELTEQDADALRRRLSSETELAQALDRVRADRQIRSHVFQLLEPSENEMQPLLANVRREMRKDDLWSSRMHTLKQLTKLAAMIVLVFGAGWISRDRLRVAPAGQPGGQIVMQQPQLQQSGPRPVTATVNPNNLQFASFPQQEDDGKIRFFPPGLTLRRNMMLPTSNPGQQVYVVRITDPTGRVVQELLTDNPQQLLEQLARSQQQAPQIVPPQPQPQSRAPQLIPVNATEQQ